MAKYPFSEIEPKWQKYWDENKTFKAVEDPSIPPEKRKYILDMFPYPSGAGLHVGHPEGYTATDMYCRYLRMKGYAVLHPMGFDSFGLPAENYAIKTGTHPALTTRENVDRFREQIKSLGFSYDWDRELSTCESDYFTWTQWIFLKLYERGLAYETDTPINFCPSCGTGLANEEVKDGKCDRCQSPVIRKNIRQWMLKITAYAEELLAGLEDLDWTEGIKQMQRNWIGRSEGANVTFAIDGRAEKLDIYTTRPDTLFGATYMVLAPEHALVREIATPERKADVEAYIAAAAHKSDLERTDLAKDKTGVFTGAYAVNPVNGARVPIWISDYVLISYGFGAIMAVPAHDDRDWDFARKFGLPIIQVVASRAEWEAKKDFSKTPETCDIEDGYSVNSGEFTGTPTEELKVKIVDWLEKRGFGKRMVNYKLRDWVFSRQRYWGEPIPLVHCPKCGVVPLKESDLPLKLPEVKTYKPTGTGESPLALITDWVNCSCPKCGGAAKRETNTMPQWAGSCWYYLRYIDPKNDKAFVDPAKENYWMPVDLYVGGAEHAVLHLLYSRFWHKVLFDLGLVSTNEPFKRLVNQGMILGEDNEKMSKSRGNVINPDDIVREYGADSLRVYEMFMGPLEVMKPWNTSGLVGVNRFLERVWNLSEKPLSGAALDESQLKILNRTIRKVSGDTDTLNFNTAISQMMIFVNEVNGLAEMPRALWDPFVRMISVYAPHLGEELWRKLGNEGSISKAKWPEYEEKHCVDDTVTVVVQVNGKLRDKFECARGTDKASLEKLALACPKAVEFMGGKTPAKIIIVPDKLVNIVVAG